jgi:hypothetical protein
VLQRYEKLMAFEVPESVVTVTRTELGAPGAAGGTVNVQVDCWGHAMDANTVPKRASM